MTTLTFKENIKIENLSKTISIYDFLDILIEKWFIPKLEKLDDSEITQDIKKSFFLSKKSKNRINI
ncbi:MAG: hypothetical protein ACD_49C00072G0006 [uncultured bacterium (gcode 4)]|uniref:Uncharacterized protein n=1 Tax=uncultured bacterium (gcode 4) TaxID=1234023 RepID=K2BUN2_9BACT|nr:MAG: hypothetical protein ACD_49C00072G0006 [uncultured bacterium (gcode 4)]